MKKFIFFIFMLCCLHSFSQKASYNFTNGSGNDITGNGYNGTFFGAASCADTLCIGLNTNDYFQIPSTVLNGSFEFSLQFKIKFSGLNISGNSPANHLFSGDLTNLFGSFALSYQKNVNKWYLCNNGSSYTFSDSSIVTNKWYCVCFTRDASGVIKFYLDGVQNTSTYTNTTPLSMTNLIIGQETDCYGGCFAANQAANAKFDDIKIYNSDISISVINSNCKPSGDTSFTCNEVAIYDFTSGSGNDSSGNGNNGSLFGASANGDSLLIGLNTNDYFQFPSTVLNGRLEFGILFKIKFTGLNISGNAPTNHLFSGDLTNSFGSFALSYQKNVNRWYLSNRSSSYTFNDSSIVADKWYCICFMRDASGVIKFYLDGVQNLSTYTDLLPLSMTNLIVGQETDCYGGCFAANQASNAKFDFIRICGGNMSAEEINTKCSSVLVINEINKIKSTLFPNPVINNLYINDASGISKIEIISVEGKILYKQTCNKQSSLSISMVDFTSGMYLVKVVYDKSVNTYKILKK